MLINNDSSQQASRLSLEQQLLIEKRLRSLSAGKQTIPKRQEHARLPLSFAQERIWFFERLQPHSSLYNRPVSIRLRGPLNVEALKQSFNEIVRRHEALRTSFVCVGDSPVQVIAPTLSLDLPVTDLCKLPEVERGAESRRLAIEEAERPFNIACDPLIRTGLLRLSDEEHVLLLSMHHIISDGWSLGVFMRELTALYEAFSTGKPSPLQDLPIQYADYAVWQRQRLQGEVLKKQLTYWKQQLSGAPAMLELPTNRPRLAVQSFRGAQCQVELPKSVSDGLKALSRHEGVTLFMTLLAAFQTLLMRYTSQSDVVVGSPIANRNRSEIEGLIGFFVNTLVLRSDLSGDPVFRELLRSVREVCLGAYAHQDIPFEKLVEELRPERSLSHAPLFQVMLVLQNAPRQELQLLDLTITSQESVNSGTAKFDLSLSIAEESEGLRGTLEYNTDLFEAATITRMLGHFQVLLEGIIADPTQRLSELPLLTQAERHQLLDQWNTTNTQYPADKCVHELFEAQVRRTPDAVAVVYEDEQLTYEELNGRANQLARYLQARGVGAEVRVGLLVERSVEMIVGVLGILKAGGAYVPLDPMYPTERVAFMLADSTVPVLLTQQRLLASLPAHAAEVVCLDRDWGKIAAESRANPQSAATAETLAYVIYTSGSTGKSKGVLVSHYNVVRLFAATEQWFGFHQQDVWTLFHSCAFDFSVWELWGALLYGGRLVVVPYWVSRSPEAFYNLLCAERVTILNQTPSAFRQLMAVEESAAEESAGKDSNGADQRLSLRFVIFGGEALEVQSLKPWFERHGEDAPQLINMYGITETTVHVTYRRLREADVSAARAGSVIGRRIPDLQIYILDRHQRLVPVGVAGELYVGGAGLARGYLNRPELTNERFIANPFSREGGARLYKTGDVGRYLPTGEIEYVGRADNQVKIRGFRIELGEVEVALAAHEGVRQALVVVREDTAGDRRLVAYVVAARGDEAAVSVRELRSYLKEHLPEYMVPSSYVVTAELPLTANGKVDRRALPEPQHTWNGEAEVGYVAARDPLEQQLADIWAAVLGVERVGIYDNFFDRGGHSLLAVQMMSQVERVCGKKLPLTTLFAKSTIAHLAHTLLQQEDEQHPSPLVQVQPGNSQRPFIFLHGDFNGGGLYCCKLVQHLGVNQPFFVLQPHGYNGQQIPPTIEAMAADHLSTLRAFQPEGPYLLGGFCQGALVAFEMARRLEQLNQKVDLLVLVHASARNLRYRLWHNLVGRFGSMFHLEPSKQLEWFIRIREFNVRFNELSGTQKTLFLLKKVKKLRSLSSKIKLARGFKQIENSSRQSCSTTQTEDIHHHSDDVYRKYCQAVDGYVPGAYSGAVTLFWPDQAPTKFADDPTMGWREVAAKVHVYAVPGEHLTCITTYVQYLAGQLKVCLHEAETPSSG